MAPMYVQAVPNRKSPPAILLREGWRDGAKTRKRTRARPGRETAVYVGDDESDEDIFALDRPGQLLTIRVGRKRDSSVAYYIHSQAEIDVLLRVLVGMRRVRNGPSGLAR